MYRTLEGPVYINNKMEVVVCINQANIKVSSLMLV